MKEVSANRIVLVNAVAAVLLIIIFFYFMSGKETVNKNPAQITDCSSIQSNYLKDACYFELAVKNSDIESCKRIIDSSQEDLCFIKVAVEKDDKTICNLVMDKFYMKPKCAGEVANVKTGQLG